MNLDHRSQLYSAEQVRELDRRAIDELGIAGYTLMHRAAQASFDALRMRWPDARSLVVLCGPGNNGGDGYELASIARREGFKVQLARIGNVPKAGDAVQAHAGWAREGGVVHEYSILFADQAMHSADVICDAIFGIGMSRDVDGVAAQAIRAINARRPEQGVIAIDVPSGLNADTGQVHGVAVRADLTISFIGRKLGLFVGQGPEHCGFRHFHDLGASGVLDGRTPALARLLAPADLSKHLPRRAAAAHKGRHGHVLVVGGDTGMSGAALLAARGALRSGAGLVSLATRPQHALQISAAQPEIMAHGVDCGDSISHLLERADVIAVGPGLGRSNWGGSLLEQCRSAGKPMVVDADALNCLASAPHSRLDARCVITPHPGEAARLLGISNADVQANRVDAARALHRTWSAVAVLKGAGSLVSGHHLALCPYGNPGMAVGGMGDVLTGIIAALMAQGLGAELSASIGVLAHAIAGDRAAQDQPRGLLPSDLIEQLRVVLNPR